MRITSWGLVAEIERSRRPENIGPMGTDKFESDRELGSLLSFRNLSVDSRARCPRLGRSGISMSRASTPDKERMKFETAGPDGQLLG
jgi:hypothetical protein